MTRQLLLSALLLIPIPAQLQTGTVTGQLSSKDGTVVSGIRVSAMVVAEPGAPTASAATLASSALADNASRFRIENVPPGRYYVTAGLIQQPTYYPGVASVAGATAISVSAGATVASINFDIVVSPGITVKGRIVRPAGLAATSNPQVMISGLVSPIQPVPVGPDGSFVLTRVRPGTYSLNVRGVPPGTQAPPVTFTAAEKDIDGIEIVLLRTGAVYGRVVIEGGGPRPGFFLTFASFKGGATNLPTGFPTNGTFLIQLPEGDYRLSWNPFPAGFFMKSLMAGSTDLLTSPLTVSSNAPQQIVATLGVSSPPPWVKVSGRVVGAPRGSSLSLVGGAAEGLIAAIKTDGSFEFPTVLPGTYQARISPELPVSPVSLVVPNKDLTDAQIVIPPLREMIPGRVVLEGGEPLRPVSLLFAVSNPAGGSVAVSASTQTDATFRVTLPEGERRIVLSAPGYTVKLATFGATDLLKDTIKVSATGSEELRVTLVSTTGPVGVLGGVVGGVVGGTGAGVSGGVLGGILSPATRPTAVPQPPMIAPTEVPREIARIVETPALPTAPARPEPPPTRVAEQVLVSNLAYHPEPTYPAEARRSRITGTVNLEVTVDRQGKVTDVRAVSGPAELRQAAIDAVKQWQYRSITVNGVIVPVVGAVTVTFSLR